VASLALVAFLNALVTAIGARLAVFVPLEPDALAVRSDPAEEVSDHEQSSVESAARQWLTYGDGQTGRLAVAGSGVIDITAVCTDKGQARGALVISRAVGDEPDSVSAADEVELGAALMPSVIDAAPAATARHALIDWASAQPGTRTAFAVSIDRLGTTNEVLGYQAGDAVLRTLIVRIEQWAGAAGRIARIDGARFIAVRTDLAEESEAIRSAEQLRDLIAAPVDLDGLGVSRSASIGVAIDPNGSATPADLLAKAAVSGAAARASGGDTVQRHNDAVASVRLSHLRLELELHDALVTDQLRVHYQPEHDLLTGRVVGVEALLRWQHPRRGLLGADTFVPYCEQTHTFTAVQHWVIEETCRQLALWLAAGASTELVVRVNVSAAQILHGAITPVLIHSLDQNRLRGEQICVEITERRMPADLSQLVDELAAWRDRGITVAIDDFGTGEGTLSHLLSLPLDVIKIDQLFVGRMLGDTRAAAVVTGVISLAESLHLGVVAEGVDGPDTAAELLRLGCTRGQGNALTEAMPPQRLEALLRSQAGSA